MIELHLHHSVRSIFSTCTMLCPSKVEGEEKERESLDFFHVVRSCVCETVARDAISDRVGGVIGGYEIFTVVNFCFRTNTGNVYEREREREREKSYRQCVRTEKERTERG